jgi:hypothetical protein
MDKTFIQHLRKILQHLFPSQANIRGREDTNTLIIAIDWPLKKDKGRPHKRSRLICIISPKNLIENYSNRPEQAKIEIDQPLVSFIQDKLKNFDPDHTAGFGEVPPQEEWTFNVKTAENKDSDS